MKIKIKNILFIFYGLFCNSCQKDEMHPQQLGIAKVNVINAVVSSVGMLESTGDVKVNISIKKEWWNSISNGSSLGQWQIFRMFTVPTNYHTVLQVVPISDTTKLWFDQLTQLNSGKSYSIYLSGTPTNVKTLLHEEKNVPYMLRSGKAETVVDSIIHIRFVNLSPSGPKVNINMVNSNALEASDLGYQEFTDFKSYSAKTSSSIRFEIRNVVDKSLVMTYDLNTNYFRFKTVSLILRGIYPIDPSLPYTSQYGIIEVTY